MAFQTRCALYYNRDVTVKKVRSRFMLGLEAHSTGKNLTPVSILFRQMVIVVI